MVSWNNSLTNHLSVEESPQETMRKAIPGNAKIIYSGQYTPSKVRRNNVRFDLEKSTVYPHLSLNDVTEEEFENMWVTVEELMESKKDYVAVVRKMMKTMGEFQETEDCCPRGLEFKTKDGARRRKRTKQRACFAVLEEQDIQRDEGVIDDAFISDVYREFSSQSALEALNRGLKDESTMVGLLDNRSRRMFEENRIRRESKSKSIQRTTRWPTMPETLATVDVMPIRRPVAI